MKINFAMLLKSNEALHKQRARTAINHNLCEWSDDEWGKSLEKHNLLVREAYHFTNTEKYIEFILDNIDKCDDKGCTGFVYCVHLPANETKSGDWEAIDFG